MTIPDGQIWMLHHVGNAYYWTRWLDALTKARVWIDDVQVKSIKVVVMPPDGLGRAEVAVRLHRQHGAVSAAELLEVSHG